MAGPVRVVLYSRPGCHLCGPARAVVERVCGDAGVPFHEVDITADAALLERFGELIPVVTVDDVVVDHWRIDPARLTSRLPH